MKNEPAKGILRWACVWKLVWRKFSLAPDKRDRETPFQSRFAQCNQTIGNNYQRLKDYIN